MDQPFRRFAGDSRDLIHQAPRDTRVLHGFVVLIRPGDHADRFGHLRLAEARLVAGLPDAAGDAGAF
jgi:hypothetical protein